MGPTATATIVGNTFKWNGYSDYDSVSDTASTITTPLGGAIYNNNSATMTINNSAFTNNAATSNGGAIWNDATLTVTDSTFSNNSAAGNGGAIYNNGHS